MLATSTAARTRPETKATTRRMAHCLLVTDQPIVWLRPIIPILRRHTEAQVLAPGRGEPRRVYPDRPQGADAGRGSVNVAGCRLVVGRPRLLHASSRRNPSVMVPDELETAVSDLDIPVGNVEHDYRFGWLISGLVEFRPCC